MANSAIASPGGKIHSRFAYAALALGLLIALAANLTYAVPRGPVTVGLGLVAPLVLPVVLFLRTTFTVENRRDRAVRTLMTLAVAGPAAAVSYAHTYELVLGAGEPWILAVLAPLSSDGLAGMATLALHRLRQTAIGPAAAAKPTQQTPSKPRPQRPPVSEAPVEQPADEPKPPAGKRAAGIDFARANPKATAKEVELAAGVSKGESYRILAAVKAEREAS